MDIGKLILGLLQTLISPGLRALLENLLNEWERVAKTTESPVDDVIVSIIKTLVGVK